MYALVQKLSNDLSLLVCNFRTLKKGNHEFDALILWSVIDRTSFCIV